MKAKWCSYRYKGTMTGFRWSRWIQHKTVGEMTEDVYAKRFGMSCVQVVVNPRGDENELWIWKPGQGWKEAPVGTRNWYKDNCDPNCPPSLITDDDIFSGKWEEIYDQENSEYAKYLLWKVNKPADEGYGTVTRSLDPALAVKGMATGTEIPTDDQLAKHII